MMKLVFLECVENLGQMGDVVIVCLGYVCNFLLLQEKVLCVIEVNLVWFEVECEVLEKCNVECVVVVVIDGEKIDGESFVLICQVGESGQFYGFVILCDIVEMIFEVGVFVFCGQVVINVLIKILGLYEVCICLYVDVFVNVMINVVCFEDEVECQVVGEDVVVVVVDEECVIVDVQVVELYEVNVECEDDEFGVVVLVVDVEEVVIEE